MRHSCKYSSRFAASQAAPMFSVLEILQPDERQQIYRTSRAITWNPNPPAHLKCQKNSKICKLRKRYLSNQNIQTKLFMGVFQLSGKAFSSKK